MPHPRPPSTPRSELAHPLGGAAPGLFAPPSRLRMAFLRGIVWGLIGAIYAPLFTGLAVLFDGLGFGHGTYIAAAACAGAVGAALYGAREVSLIGSGIGVLMGVGAVILLPDRVEVLHVCVAAAALAAAVGLTVAFPARCSRHVAGKTVAGLAMGAVGGGILAAAEPLHPHPFSVFAVLAFLVSVNGVLYVATVRWWVSLTERAHGGAYPCYVIESTVMASLAALAAGSVWMAIGPLLSLEVGLWSQASHALHQQVPMAVLGGLVGGGVAGALLALFRFSWVHDLQEPV